MRCSSDGRGRQAQLTAEGRALLDSPNMLLANIREDDAIDRIFQDVRPEVVFHAAALKHLPLLERFPIEAYKTNVLGTLNLLRAAASVGVERFVNVSTDKAADPCSVMGASKRAAEQVVFEIGRRHDLPFVDRLDFKEDKIKLIKKQNRL